MTSRSKTVAVSTVTVIMMVAAAVCVAIYFVRPDLRQTFFPYVFGSVFLSGFALGVLLTNLAYQE